MKMKNNYTIYLIMAIMLTMASCQAIPKGAQPIPSFKVEKYLGTWYEVARLDFKFEENLTNTTATYSLISDSKIKVLNEGFDTLKNKWTEASGKAKFRDKTDEAALKVSFFGPFYAGYNVIAIKGDYEYALVAGSNTEFLWILARQPSIPDDIKLQFLNIAEDIGYNTSQLIWVAHDKIGEK